MYCKSFVIKREGLQSISLIICYFRDIDEAEYLLDQLGAPDKDEDKLVTKLRDRLRLFLSEIREGAEGFYNDVAIAERKEYSMFYTCIGSGKRD